MRVSASLIVDATRGSRFSRGQILHLRGASLPAQRKYCFVSEMVTRVTKTAAGLLNVTQEIAREPNGEFKQIWPSA
jgi:hypothetical protein